MTITTIPTRTVGSLGPEKIDRRAVSDPYQQLGADEWNLQSDCTIHLVNSVGTETGYSKNSLLGHDDHRTLVFRDNFLGQAAEVMRSPWGPNFGGLDWHYIGLAGGGVYGTLDAVDLEVLQATVDRAHAPRMQWQMSVDGSPGTQATVMLLNDGGNECVGVEFIDGANAINAYRMAGGVRVATQALGTWVVSTEYTFTLSMTGAGLTTVSMNSGTAVSVGTLGVDGVHPALKTSADGDGGKFAFIRNFMLTADWTTA